MASRSPLPLVVTVLCLGACTPKAPAVGAASPAATRPAASAARLMAPADYVRGFYVKEPAWSTPKERRALFEPELAAALIEDSSDPGEVGAIDFSVFCGCQDGDIRNVATIGRDVPGGAEVTARFTLEGKPTTIVYRLLTTRAGYRIDDISAPAQNGDAAWDLRGLLGMNKTA